ncbi:hypothetical protein [Pseudonocardia humida]|uniref:Uncharacterized protein n=1 Tax=Pseudonocardia humida TaxID=2800819 RepID=A0ABT1A6D6_9PSEU|nr:hypothetical protein [Pseudonocardia humida]MCO1658541.1 hypothetical protein [Pseudonocardia humida]
MVTVDRLRELFSSDLPDPQLVVVEGGARVVAGTTEDEGLFVASRRELLERFGGEPPTGRELDELAVSLDATVGTLGG